MKLGGLALIIFAVGLLLIFLAVRNNLGAVWSAATGPVKAGPTANSNTQG